MGSIQKSARDPIFWLHHANIDRLWTAWMKSGNRFTPPLDSQWAKTAWKFDESGEWLQTAGAMLDSSKPPLGYRYDDETVPIEPLIATPPQAVSQPIETKSSPGIINWLKGLRGLTASPPKGAISSTSASVKLGNNTVAVDLKIPHEESMQLSNWVAGGATDIETATLVLQDIRALEVSHGFSFTILVSLPDTEPTVPAVVVDALGPFGLSLAKQHGQSNKPTLEFPLSEILPAFDNLSPTALESGLRVTFEPAHPPKEGSPDNLIEIGEVRLDVTTAAQ